MYIFFGFDRNRDVHDPRMNEPKTKQEKMQEFAEELLRSNGK